MIREIFPIEHRVPNSADSLHCVQASFAMTVAALSGDLISSAEAEAATGFKEGVETWPYRMIEWFTSHGFEVRHIDQMDAERFAEDPERELKDSGFTDDLIQYFRKISDYSAESAAIKNSISHGAIYEARLPQLEDLVKALRDGWLPICVLDAGALTQEYRTGYQGHMVLVNGIDDDGQFAKLQDPGPPPHWDWEVPTDLIVKAMRTPVESSGTITLVRSLG